jgi:hypothetical protein
LFSNPQAGRLLQALPGCDLLQAWISAPDLYCYNAVKKAPSMPTPVSLNIKNPEIHEVAVRLARLQGVTITAAVLSALRAELNRVQSTRRGSEVERMEEYSRRIAALSVLDVRSDDAILGYNVEGHLDGLK